MISYHTCPLATLGGKDTGGMNVYVRDLTRQLGRLGIHVDIFTRSQDDHVPHVLHDLGYGNRVVHITAGPETPLPKQELPQYLAQFVDGIQAFALSKGIQYDLIHSHYWMSGLAARDLKQSWQVPIVHMFHTLGIMKQRVARESDEADSSERLQGEGELLRIADRIVSPTPAELAQLQWLYQADVRKVVIIPPGVDLGHFYPIPVEEAKEFIGVNPCESVVLYVGRIEPLKGIDTLIDAIGILKHKGVIVCLSIIGGDPDLSPEAKSAEMARLQTLRERDDLKDLVAFLGRRSQDTLPYYYSAAEAVVVPSHYESFGMVALEAMACGTPVVASQVGGLAFLVQDGVTGFTIPVEDPHALAERLILLVQDAELRKKMSASAANFALNYSWQKIAPRIVQVYNDVLESAVEPNSNIELPH